MRQKFDSEDARALRARYLSNELTHDEYYLTIADTLGIPDSLVPASIDELRKSTDVYMNDIPLARWDRMDASVRHYAAGLPWSISDTVCVLKAIARRIVIKDTTV